MMHSLIKCDRFKFKLALIDLQRKKMFTYPKGNKVNKIC